MCHVEATVSKPLSAEEAAAQLCRLISRECRVDIFPGDLVKLLKTHESRVVALIGMVLGDDGPVIEGSIADNPALAYVMAKRRAGW